MVGSPPVSSVVKHNTIGAGGLGFDSRAGLIVGHSVAKGLPLLRLVKLLHAAA